jgi:hypothetical protein
MSVMVKMASDGFGSDFSDFMPSHYAIDAREATSMSRRLARGPDRGRRHKMNAEKSPVLDQEHRCFVMKTQAGAGL